MKYIAIVVFLFIPLISPAPSLADTPPAGMSRLPGTAFIYLYSDDHGRSIAIMPAHKTTEINQACETHQPLWIYGTAAPGKCLARMPSRFQEEEGIVELQVTFSPRGYKEILLLSTVDINKEKPSFRSLNSDELALLASKFPKLLKSQLMNKAKASDAGANDKFFFIPLEKIADPTDDPSDPPCTRLKTAVFIQHGNGLSKTGMLDNMPKYIIHTGLNTYPMAITYTYCNTGASLWKIYPTVEEKADFSNAVGG